MNTKALSKRKMNRDIMKKSINKTLRQVFFITIFFVCVFPMYFMFTSSIKSEEEFLTNKYLLPASPTLENFHKSLTKGGSHFFDWFKSSIIITVTSTLISLVFAILIAFMFSQIRTKFTNGLLNFTVSLMVVPPIIMIIPLFKMMATFKIINTYLSVIIIYIGIVLPFSIYVLTSFFKTISNDIIDAASIDGCSLHKVLFKIVLPMSRPSIVTVIVVNALFCWNELLVAMVFLQSMKLKTLMAALIIFKNKNLTDIPIIMAGLAMMTVPIIILYFVGMRYFIKGLSAGAVKG